MPKGNENSFQSYSHAHSDLCAFDLDCYPVRFGSVGVSNAAFGYDHQYNRNTALDRGMDEAQTGMEGTAGRGGIIRRRKLLAYGVFSFRYAE